MEAQRKELSDEEGKKSLLDASAWVHHSPGGRVSKIIQTLAKNPKRLDKALDDLNSGKGLSAFLDLEGVRAELGAVAAINNSDATKIAAYFLHNKLLENLKYITADESANLFNTIFEHPFTQQQLTDSGLRENAPAVLEHNANLFMQWVKTCDQSTLEALGKSLANFVEKGQDIDQIRNIVLSTLKKPESRTAAFALIANAANTFTRLLNNHVINEEKSKVFPVLISLDQQIAEAKKDVKRLAALETQRKDVAKQAKITSFDEITFNLRKTLGIKPDGSIKQLSEAALPFVEKILNRPEELENLIKEAANGITADLVKQGIELLAKPDILPTVANQEMLGAYNSLAASPLDVLANMAIDFFNTKGVLDVTMDGAKTIVPAMLDLPAAQEILGIDETQALQYQGISQIAIDYTKAIAKEALKYPEELKSIAKALQEATTENSPEKFAQVIKDGVALVNKPDLIAKIANKETLKAMASSMLESPAQALAAIDIICDNKEYLQNIVSIVANKPEIVDIVISYQEYTKAEGTDKPKHLASIIKVTLDLINDPAVEAAVSSNLDNIIDQVEKSPALAEMVKEIIPLKQILKDASPMLLKAAQEGVKLAGAEELMVKAIGLAHKPEKVSNTEITNLATEAFEIYLKDDKIYHSINNNLDQDKQKIAGIIDQSLKMVKKESTELKLLKPLGINGEFMVEMIKRVNNPQGLEAIKAFAKDQSISNAWKIISSTQSRSFVVGHIVSSGIKYLFSEKSKSKPKEKSLVVEDANNITAQTGKPCQSTDKIRQIS